MGRTRPGKTTKETTKVESSGRVGRRLVSSGRFISSETIVAKEISYVFPRNVKPTNSPSNYYSVEQILQMGKDRFFEIASPKEPVPIPDLGFSEEEKRAIDKMMTGEGE